MLNRFCLCVATTAILIFAGCSGGSGKNPDGKQPADGAGEEAHDHSGQHGGALIEVGGEVAHLEFVHNPKDGEAIIYLTGSDAKTALSIADAPELKLQTDDGPKIIKLEAVDATDGKASQFSIKDDALKSDPLKGRITITINDKTYQPEIKDAHDHGDHEGHDHGEGEGHDKDEHEGHDHAEGEGHDKDEHEGHDHAEGEGHDHDDHKGHDHD